MDNGIFSTREEAPEVRAWERRQEMPSDLIGEQVRKTGNRSERLGEIVDELSQKMQGSGFELNSESVGMGENDLMSKGAMKADEEFQSANMLLKNYGGASVNRLAGRGADPVTDDKVVGELVEAMEQREKELGQTGDVNKFYNRTMSEFELYRRGQLARADSEVVG